MKKLDLNEYMTLVEQAPIMIWRANTTKLCDYFNVKWLEFTGRSFEQEYGFGWAEGVHSDDLQKCVSIYESSFEKNEIFEMRYRLKRYDGEYRWIFDRGVPFYDEKKAFLGYIGSCIDITESVLAEEELLKMNNEKIKNLEKLLPLCAWCKNIRNDVGQWVNFEEYMKEKNQSVTHTICSTCSQKI